MENIKKAMISVKTDDFVAALKRLKVHQKRRRKLNILIRQGAGVVFLALFRLAIVHYGSIHDSFAALKLSCELSDCRSA